MMRQFFQKILYLCPRYSISLFYKYGFFVIYAVKILWI